LRNIASPSLGAPHRDGGDALMARPRTPVGTFGDIQFETAANGRVRARTRVRDDDGRLRRVQATGPTTKAAEHNLKAVLAQRDRRGDHPGELTADSPFTQLVEVWLDDLELEGRVADSTRWLYEYNMRHLVMPTFEHYTLREITVSKIDRFLKAQAKQSYNRARQAKVVLSLAFGLAVRYEAISRNPVAGTARLRRPPSQTVALTEAQIDAIRQAVRQWRRGGGLSGPKPDGQLEQVIEVMLGTSARIGEVLAIRKCDVDVTDSPATVRICGTVVSPSGKPAHRQDHPKTSKSTRIVSVPSFAAEVLRQRLVAVADEHPEHLLFFSRNHTPLRPHNIRRKLRVALTEAGIEGVTPHAFRRTVATVLNQANGADLAAEMLGHTSSEITKAHYIADDERVNPVTAEILEALAPRRHEEGEQ
jgi:integrase